MHKKISIRKNKILFYYFLAIVLPSVVLGALAFRGVINDQAINEREISRQLTEAGAKIIAESDLFITKIEKQFLQKANLTGIPPSYPKFFEDSILSEFLQEEPGMEGIFYIQPSVKDLTTTPSPALGSSVRDPRDIVIHGVPCRRH